MDSNSKVYDVVVVGCGASGIAAITRLFQEGVSVLGLEGSNRIGGRIHTIEFGANVIDLGAQWCHGEEGNIVYGMAKELNLVESSPAGIHFTFVHANGDVESNEINQKLEELYFRIDDESKDHMKNSSRPLGMHYLDMFNSYLKTPEYSIINSALGQQAIELFQKYQNSIDASDTWFDTSAEGQMNYIDCPGDSLLHWKGRGYKTILDVLMKKIPNPEEELPIEILFNKEVNNINIVDRSKDNTTVQVKCKDGSVYTAKHVIITVSVGVLKARYAELFAQPLPETKVISIHGIAFGAVDKIFFLYDVPWWPANFRWVGFLWTAEDKAKLSPGDRWLTEVTGFNTVDTQPGLALFWTSGAVARYMESLSLDAVKDGICRLVQMFFGKTYNIPHPKEVKRSQWYSNDLIKGSYSSRSVSSESLGANQKDLGAPVLNDLGTPVICFGGEATSINYFSTVHGAIEAGFREADRLKTYLKPKSQPMALDTKTFNKTEVNSCKVLIIGAGLAGIAAAKALFLANIEDIIILEAQHQIGGRICSMVSNGGYIEYGAHWIHGENSMLKNFAQKHNLLSTIPSDEGQGRFLRDDGYEFDSKFINKVENIIVAILKRCELFSESNDICNFSVGEYLETEFEKYIQKNVCSKDMTLWRELFEWHIKFQVIDNSCDSLKSLSAKSWGLYDFDGGDSQSHINFKDGYVSVLNKLMQLLPNGIVKCDTPVTNIIWNATECKKHRVKVICENNNVFWTDHVIATMSLGVLKSRYREMFSPHLPEKHVMSIKSMGFASIGKIFLQFESNWWGDIKGIQLVWKVENATKNKDYFKLKKSSWVQHLSGFDVLTVGPPNSLLGWVDCQGVTTMESLTKEEVANDCLMVLKRFTGRKEFPRIKNIERSMWDSNQYVRGCYSHITMDCDRAEVGPKTLSEPIMDNEGCPVLVFAGEACHQTFFSTTHGAFDSGTKQAGVVCQYILNHN